MYINYLSFQIPRTHHEKTRPTKPGFPIRPPSGGGCAAIMTSPFGIRTKMVYERWQHDLTLNGRVLGKPCLKRPCFRFSKLVNYYKFDWSTGSPPNVPPPKEIACFMIRVYENHWFPLVWPAMNCYFSGQGGTLGGFG